jgi:hypothetical protein
MMNTRSLGIAFVFVAGCAVGGASARFVVPPASAQQAATLTKWEYTCAAASGTLVADRANQLGAEGWEVAGTSSGSTLTTWCFKRPKM